MYKMLPTRVSQLKKIYSPISQPSSDGRGEVGGIIMSVVGESLKEIDLLGVGDRLAT
jgi:hypothetical protein